MYVDNVYKPDLLNGYGILTSPMS